MNIAQYNFSDNENLPRIIDSIKRDFNIDLNLDYIIENVGECLHLIGLKSKVEAKEYYKVPTNKQIDLSCFVDDIISVVDDCNRLVYYDFRDNMVIIDNDMYIDKYLTIHYTLLNVDKNGFPKIGNEDIYFACMYYCLYKYLLRKMFMTGGDMNMFQFIENKKNQYILQVRAKITNQEFKKIIDTQYSVYNRQVLNKSTKWK